MYRPIYHKNQTFMYNMNIYNRPMDSYGDLPFSKSSKKNSVGLDNMTFSWRTTRLVLRMFLGTVS